MNRVSRRAGLAFGLVVLLWVSLSWGQLPPTNDISDSNSNTGGGTGALGSKQTGFFNAAYGAFALFSNTTGNNNIAVGSFAGGTLTTGDNNIYLGSDASSPTESNTMRLGSGQSTYISGIAHTVTSRGTPVFITSDGQLGTTPSPTRDKGDIQSMGVHSRGLFQLRPVIFRYKQDPQGERQYGLIAEEVAKVYPELVIQNAQGQIEAIRYQALTPMLLNEVQHQQRQLGAQA